MIKHIFLICICLIVLSSCKETASVISLATEWQFAIDSTDVGMKEKWYRQTFTDKIQLPGTMNEAGYGCPNQLLPSIEKPQILHLTSKHRYVGPAWYSTEVTIPENWKGKLLELKLERVLWQSTVWVDGTQVPGFQESLVTPHLFNLTDYLSPGKHKISIRVDNRKRYDMSTRDMAHAYTNETQIMWNGILGEISLTAKETVSIENMHVYPDIQKKQILVKVTLNNSEKEEKGKLYAEVNSVNKRASIGKTKREINISSGKNTVEFICPLNNSAQSWSEFNPALYDLNLQVETSSTHSQKKVRFGMREISRNHADLLLNNQKIFLRGTLECCIFPLTGRPPMNREGWNKVFLTAREWGLNHLRFHSWCPPEAAFQVADSLGFYLQVELPLWSLTVGQDKKMNAFLYTEAERILTEYGNHPSFCFLSLGNELQPDFQYLTGLLEHVKGYDPRHLYTTTSFTFEKGHGDWPEPEDDFFITQWTKKGWVRGQGVFDTQSPTFDKDYIGATEGIGVPLITHEIGQYAVYPDLKEIEKYKGVLTPLNFMGVKQELEKKGLIHKADEYLMASGKLAALLYKEEIERALKTSGISGFQLLDLHDFPGQGSALVGLLNAFWESKGVAEATSFRQFCAPVVPLARFPKAVYTDNEAFTASIEVANYSDRVISNHPLSWLLKDESGKELQKGNIPYSSLAIGHNCLSGQIYAPLNKIEKASRLTLSVSLEGIKYHNEWSIWVYPSRLTVEENEIIVTTDFKKAQKALDEGKKVLYTPRLVEVNGLEGKFVPVFWSPVHFPKQAGTMGILCNSSHPVFEHFPTENHTNWQWWSLLKQSKTVVLDSLPTVTPLVEIVDNFVNNRKLANLFEVKVGQGKLIFCSMDIMSDWQTRPEARQLYFSILEYMKTDKFNPIRTLEYKDLETIIKTEKTEKKYSVDSIYN